MHGCGSARGSRFRSSASITINLAPADLHKEGGRFDPAIALGILAASGQIDAQSLDKYEFLGELALTGELRGADGVLPAAIAAARDGITPTYALPARIDYRD